MDVAKQRGGPPLPAGAITGRVLHLLEREQSAGRPLARVAPDEGDQPLSPELPRELLDHLVPPRFRDASFATYTPRTKGQRAALKATQQWVERAQSGQGSMLALIGTTGVGKSHLLYAAANALLGPRPRFPIACYSRPWYRLANELRYGGDSPFRPGHWLEPVEVRALLHRQRIVLIDEVRPTARTEFDDTELTLFAAAAWDARVAVLITTNVSPLADVMGAPAASRFTQIVVDGPDGRHL